MRTFFVIGGAVLLVGGAFLDHATATIVGSFLLLSEKIEELKDEAK